MKLEKAYKILAKQENISNNQAKALIDGGLVMHGGKRLEIARGMMPVNSVLKIAKIDIKILFENDELLAIYKPIGIASEQIKNDYILLNRLDKDTSGIVLFAKTKEFCERAKNEYKNERVQKLYIAVVKGIVSEPYVCDESILTIKGKSAFSKISQSSEAKSAYSMVAPLLVSGKKSLVKVQIKTGRTHQIRVHLNARGNGIFGDIKYSKLQSSRLMLHCLRTKIFDYDIICDLPRDFHAEFDLKNIDKEFLF